MPLLTRSDLFLLNPSDDFFHLPQFISLRLIPLTTRHHASSNPIPRFQDFAHPSIIAFWPRLKGWRLLQLALERSLRHRILRITRQPVLRPTDARRVSLHPPKLTRRIATNLSSSNDRVSNIPTLVQAGYAGGSLLVTPLGDMLRRRQLVLSIIACSSLLSIGLALSRSVIALEIVSFFLGLVTVSRVSVLLSVR